MKKIAILNLFNFLFFILMVAVSNNNDIFKVLGCISMLAIPVLFICFVVVFIKYVFSKIKIPEVTQQNESSIQDSLPNKKIIQEANKYKKYKDYNYSYSTYKNTPKQPFDFEKTDLDKEHSRIKRAKYENFVFKSLDIEQGKATVLNKEGTKEYFTSLNSCTCSDYKERKLPCKHIYRLAGLCGSFDLFADEEYETIQRLMPLWSKLNLCSKLIDVFYRIRDSKNKYYVKTSPLLKELEQMQYITITEIPDDVYIDFKYNANELRGMLIGKEFKKSSSKKELVNLIISDSKLLKKISKPLKHVKLNFNEKQTEYLLECLNYICYYKDSRADYSLSKYNDGVKSKLHTEYEDEMFHLDYEAYHEQYIDEDGFRIDEK